MSSERCNHKCVERDICLQTDLETGISPLNSFFNPKKKTCKISGKQNKLI